MENENKTISEVELSLITAISGLDNKQIYEIILEFVPIGNRKYKFEYGQPLENGNAEAFNKLKGNLLAHLK